MKLRDKVAVVTGAGRGIGRAICARYIEEGAFVFVTDIDETKARSVATEFSQRVRMPTTSSRRPTM